MPESLLVDQGSVFLSDVWKFGCELNNIKLKTTGTVSHKSLGSGETYHAYLRRIYSKLHSKFLNIHDHLNLSCALKAIEKITGPARRCPALLVFGSSPQPPFPTKRDHPTQTQRQRADSFARSEYEPIVSMKRLRLAARRPVPAAASTNYAPGDKAYVYSEKQRTYSGSHMIASAHKKCARLHVGERTGPRA